MLEFLFNRNSITAKVERKQKLLGDVEVLKKQQKVESEKILKDFDAKKIDLNDSIQAQINALQAQIASLKNHRLAQLDLLDEQRKVALDKKINDYDRQIISKQNKAKRLARFIDAEKQNMEDVMNPGGPNAPSVDTTKNKQLLFEEKVKVVRKK